MGITSDQDLNDYIKGGTDDTVIGNSGDRLKVDAVTLSAAEAKDFDIELALGNVSSYNYINKFGANTDIDAGVTEDVWDGGGIYPWPTSAQTTTVASTSANDTSGGTGARTVAIQGLIDTAGVWTKVTETVTLNGTTNVTCSNNFIRIFRVQVKSAGSLGQNDGDIQVKHSSTVLAQMLPGKNQTLMAVYTTPSNTTSVIVDWYAEVSRLTGSTGTKFAEVEILCRPYNEVFQVRDYRALVSGSSLVLPRFPLTTIPEKTDIVVKASADSNNTAVFAGFQVVESIDG
jgi:hypothetical protein